MKDAATQEITDEQKRYAAARLQEMPLARHFGMHLVDLAPGEAVIELEMRPDLEQPFGIMHGGVTATLIDTAMAYAVRTRVGPTEPTATIDLTIHYIRPHAAGKCRCIARVVRAGKRIFTVTADVENEKGKLIATAVSTYTRV
ncbi:MAG: PaaI family thioesterase [Pyrinomonadaceae bacterium]